MKQDLLAAANKIGKGSTLLKIQEVQYKFQYAVFDILCEVYT